MPEGFIDPSNTEGIRKATEAFVRENGTAEERMARLPHTHYRSERLRREILILQEHVHLQTATPAEIESLAALKQQEEAHMSELLGRAFKLSKLGIPSNIFGGANDMLWGHAVR